ncbi:hypothetical protein [Chondrinema litorale]|uniref:hypothetical protein n=1 Tax=Chondrinema litorale TaxID=2994555 RepID=UPI00254282A6|nr:hypothetical protein [Chondrinema litorale]UZR99157.1 hypothetical protein OQ292_34690 [Chondrinema litorale]
MLKKIFVLAALSVILLSKAFSQGNFREGFIIKHETDTVFGLVEFRPNAKNYESCIFKKDGKITEYYPEQIQGFGYINERVFTSTILSDAFIEVVVLGKINLYKTKSNYILQKDGSNYVLESKKVQTEVDGKTIVMESSPWRGIIAFLVSDCTTSFTDRINSLALNELELSRLIIKYNQWVNADYKVFKQKYPWLKLAFGVNAGFVNSMVKVNKKLAIMPIWMISIVRLTQLRGYLFLLLHQE